jgi:hypothetical protein
VQTIAQGQAKPWGLAVEGGYVYWSNGLGGAILRAPSDGSGSPQVVASATQPTDIALFQGNVYWIDLSDGNVWSAPEAGGSGVVAVMPPAPVSMIGSPQGPFVISYSSSDWWVTSVAGQWATRVDLGYDNGNSDMAQDGTNLYYGGQGCIGALGLANGQSAGCVYTSVNSSAPLAAYICGILHPDTYYPRASPNTLTPALTLARRGVTWSMGLLDAAVDRAAIAAGFVYFHSTTDNAIGKLPLP